MCPLDRETSKDRVSSVFFMDGSAVLGGCATGHKPVTSRLCTKCVQWVQVGARGGGGGFPGNQENN